MKRLGVCGLLFAAVMVGVPAQARAASIRFDLTCTVVSATSCPAAGLFGSVTLSDNNTLVDVTIDMLGTLPQVLSLNWDTANYGALPGSGWTTTNGTSILKFQTDNAGAFNRFDIAVWDNTAPLTNPLTFSLGNTTLGNLDVANFLAKDDQNQLYAAVKTATVVTPSANAVCGDPSGTCYGATTFTPVPEPSTLTLLGLGLVSAVRAGHRKMRKS